MDTNDKAGDKEKKQSERDADTNPTLAIVGKWVRDQDGVMTRNALGARTTCTSAAGTDPENKQVRCSSMTSSGGFVVIGEGNPKMVAPGPPQLRPIAPKPSATIVKGYRTLESLMQATEYSATGTGSARGCSELVFRSAHLSNDLPLTLIPPKPAVLLAGEKHSTGSGSGVTPPTNNKGVSNNLKIHLCSVGGGSTTVTTAGGTSTEEGKQWVFKGSGQSVTGMQNQASTAELLTLPSTRAPTLRSTGAAQDAQVQYALHRLLRRSQNRESARKSRERKREVDQQRVHLIKGLFNQNQFLKRKVNELTRAVQVLSGLICGGMPFGGPENEDTASQSGFQPDEKSKMKKLDLNELLK